MCKMISSHSQITECGSVKKWWIWLTSNMIKYENCQKKLSSWYDLGGMEGERVFKREVLLRKKKVQI